MTEIAKCQETKAKPRIPAVTHIAAHFVRTKHESRMFLVIVRLFCIVFKITVLTF